MNRRQRRLGFAAWAAAACWALVATASPAHAAEAKQVSAGDEHTCAVLESGKVRC